LTTVIFIKVETGTGNLKKFVRVSTIEKKIDFEVLMTQRGI